MNAPLRLLPGQALDASRYEAACRLIAEVSGLDEVKAIRDQAEALRVLARQARNLEPEIACAEIRIRAERRLGEIMAGHVAAGLIRPGQPATRGDGTDRPRVKLAELGIDERLADRCRKYAALAAEDFASRLEQRRRDARYGSGRVRMHLDFKAERRAAKEAELGARVAAWPTRRYGLILADPEWRYEPFSRETGLDRAAENHYPTSTLADICARDVAAIAAPDCVLALWAIVPMLAEAFCVLDAWGFGRFDRDPASGHLGLDKREGRYVSSGVWTKHSPGFGIGLGFWFRVDHEILLLATRGRPPAPVPGTQARSIFDVPASRVHSAKPDLVAEILEGYFPTVPKIELNRRGPARPGWDAWGNEAEQVAEDAA